MHKKEQLHAGQHMADFFTTLVGSWFFILSYLVFVCAWVVINVKLSMSYGNNVMHDPFPFIFLNLILAFLTALQAPIILMSQNRAAERDRLRANYDYQVNRKAEREIELIKKQLDRIEKRI